jgi:predicted GTPase
MAEIPTSRWLGLLKRFYSLAPSSAGIPYVVRKVSKGIQRNETFRILLIGETGTGKSTLINNILGKKVAKVGHTTNSETEHLTEHEGEVCGIQVKIYDSPGLNDSRKDKDKEEAELQKLQSNLQAGKFAMVIFCFKMTETRMSTANIDTLCTYHEKLGLDWRKVIIALTFADAVPGMDDDRLPDKAFQVKWKQWDDQLRETLSNKVKLDWALVQSIRILPVTNKYTKNLPNKTEWFTPLWLSVLEILDARPMFCYLQMHLDHIHISGAPPPSAKEMGLVKEFSHNQKIPSASLELEMEQFPRQHEAMDEGVSKTKEPREQHTPTDSTLSPWEQPKINIFAGHDDGHLRRSRLKRFRDAIVRGFMQLYNLPHNVATAVANFVGWLQGRQTSEPSPNETQ